MQLRDWAVLDTFDMLAPSHDRPQSIETLRRWCAAAGLEDVEVFRKGQVIARGRAPRPTPASASGASLQRRK